MRSAPRLPVLWDRPRRGARLQNGSPSSRTRRQPLGGWYRTNPAQGSTTPFGRGNTLQHCDGPGADERLRQRSQTPTRWNC